MLGVDGTTGGIKSAVVSGIQPVWIPPEGTRESRVHWTILERCCIPNAVGSGKAVVAANKFRTGLRCLLKTLVNSSTSHADFQIAAEELSAYSDTDIRIPVAILIEFKRWSILDSGDERARLRPILVCVASDESALQVIHPNQVNSLTAILHSLRGPAPSQFHWDQNCRLLRNAGMGPEFVAVINLQFSTYGKPQQTTVAMFDYLRE
jgi:hypothetical protein